MTFKTGVDRCCGICDLPQTERWGECLLMTFRTGVDRCSDLWPTSNRKVRRVSSNDIKTGVDRCCGISGLPQTKR